MKWIMTYNFSRRNSLHNKCLYYLTFSGMVWSATIWLVCQKVVRHLHSKRIFTDIRNWYCIRTADCNEIIRKLRLGLFFFRFSVKCLSPRYQLHAAIHSGILGRNWLDLGQWNRISVHKLGRKPAEETSFEKKLKITRWEMAYDSWFKSSTSFL